MQLSGVQIQKLAKSSKGRKHVLKFRGGHRAKTSVNEVGGLHRAIDWKGAFWIASGVPALVLISIGGIGDVEGKLAFLVWTISVCMGL